MSFPKYQIEIQRAAIKQPETLYRSDRKLAAQFNSHILSLSQTPYPTDVVVLEHSEQYDFCRTKVGRSWRLHYAVIGEHTLVLILDAESREKAYKGKDLDTLRNRILTFLETLSE